MHGPDWWRHHPDSVNFIGNSAFSGCKGLTGVTIPDSVTYLGESAFQSCTGLTGLTIPGSVTGIAYSAFNRCTGLTSVTIPDSVSFIGNSAFSGCTGLTGVTIPGSVISIGHSSFQGCTGLTSVTIPAGVKIIQWNAFADCSNLKTAFFEGNAPADFSDYTFERTPPGVTISYYEGALGFTSPTWRGYASVAVPRPVEDGALRVESLSLEGGVAILRVSGGRRGWTYTLRRGADLNLASWQSVGTAGPLGADGELELRDTAPPPSRAFYHVTGQAPQVFPAPVFHPLQKERQGADR